MAHTPTGGSSGDPTSIELDVWRLLPWLANGTLEGQELERVLDHLKRSPRCREELLFLSELRHAVELAAPQYLDVPDERLAGLIDRIDAYERKREPNPGSKRAATTLHWLPQAALVALLAGLVWWAMVGRAGPDTVPQTREPSFQTLSWGDTGSTDTQPGISARVRLIPKAGLSEEELRRLVLGVGAEIVAGPTTAGVYTLGWRQIDDESPSSERIAAELRADARVALAEPVRGP
ncbi:MAG: zf-HC2 domain-containing protein [Thermoanaerobaculia bacterium]|nr:zf-HC2 domain-containing protein [Thermoanaerobaculia bacterium]